jgi:cytochrome P450
MNHYHFWEACVKERKLLDQAVEESLRWRATDPVFPRLCTQDTEVEGVLVPAGTRVHLCLGAANHDPAVFKSPEDYDIFRDKSHQMGFGFGPHRCLGMDVARQEMIVAISGLMDRFPNMKIDPDKPKPAYRGLDHRGMSAVTVRLKG